MDKIISDLEEGIITQKKKKLKNSLGSEYTVDMDDLKIVIENWLVLKKVI